MQRYRKPLKGLILLTILLLSLKPPLQAEAAQSFLLKEGIAPPGANDPDCQPDEEHPYPLVLVPGTFETMAQNWAVLSPFLAAKGFCVYALNYGFTKAGPSTGPIEQSARELKQFVENILHHTKAKKVSIIGHSQGGMMPRYYIRFLDGASQVEDLIALASSNHGTTGIAGLSRLTWSIGSLSSCTACLQQKAGSQFLQHLNRGDESPGPVSYTNIATIYDEVVVPYTSAFLNGPDWQVTNITLQTFYPKDLSEHIGIAYNPHVFPIILEALNNEGPANPMNIVN